jgi:hypothetical protein
MPAYFAIAAAFCLVSVIDVFMFLGRVRMSLWRDMKGFQDGEINSTDLALKDFVGRTP